MLADVSTLASVLCVTAIAGTAQTVAGFGFALIFVPVMMTVLGVVDTVALAALLGILNASLVARAAFRHVPWRPVLLLLAGSVAGMPIGLALLLGLPAEALRAIVAVSAMSMAAAIAAGLRWRAPGSAGVVGVGVVSGVLSTSTGMNGPPIVLFLQACEYPPTVFRGALSTFFVLNGVVSLTVLSTSGVIGRRSLGLAACALPVLLAANWLGHRLVERMSARFFRRLVLGLLIASAFASLVSTLARLRG